MLSEIINENELDNVLVNEDLANRSTVGSTKDGGPRPISWNPPLVTKLDNEIENPYHR